jgi:hypothetical protein
MVAGSRLAQSGTQADPHVKNSALGPHFSSAGKAGAAIPSPKAQALNNKT